MANQYANESKRAMSGATPKAWRRDGRQLVLHVGTIQQPASGATVAAPLGQSLEQPAGPPIRAVRCQVGVAEDPDQAARMGYRKPPHPVFVHPLRRDAKGLVRRDGCGLARAALANG